jgi:hypothetical protein
MDFDILNETITPINTSVLTVNSVGALVLPKGSTAQRPTAVAGMVRMNTTGYTAGTALEYYDGTTAAWEFLVDGSNIVSGGGFAVSVDNVAGQVIITSTNSGSGTNFNYSADTNSQAAGNPGVGNIRWNNAVLTSATSLYISSQDGNGVDQTNYFNTLITGSQIYIQDQNSSTTFQRWTINSIAFTAGAPGYYTFGVTLINSANFATINNNHKLYASFAGPYLSGTVTSVNASGGTTGLSFSGGPITTSGTLTLAGTLGTTNGGTGLTSIGAANQVLGVNTGATGLEYKSIVAGAGISITPTAGALTIAASIGGVTTFQYNSKTNSQAAANPGAGNLVWNNTVLTSATQLYISATDSNGIDQTVLFNYLNTNNILYVQDANNSSIFQRWQITSITNNTGWYTLGVTLLTSAGFASMSNNHGLYLGWGSNGTGAAAVTSVGLALPSIFTVSGSPVTSTGTLTGTLVTQANNLVFAGPATGGPLTPTFRALSLATNDINDVTITSATSGQALVYNGTKWVNTNATASASTGNIGVTPSGGGTAWSLVSGNIYTANYVHNLGTTNVVITIYNTTDNSIIVPHYCTTSNSNTVTIQVVGNTTTLKVVVIANGLSMANTTAATVTTQLNGATVSTATDTLNFTGPTVSVTGASNVATVTIGSRFTYYANSMDSPNTADYAVNAFAPIITDPTYTALTVRAFSNTVEQGVSCLVSVPVNATTITIRLRGRAQTAPGAASNVQPRVYTRLLPDNATVGAWSAGVNLSLIAIPTNANFQYYVYTGTLASVNLTAGNLYQFELTRYITGVTSNLASNFYMAEMTMEIV